MFSCCCGSVKTNWRNKLTFLSLLLLVMIILYQRNQLQRADNFHKALKVESKIAGDDIADVADKLKQLQEQKMLAQNIAAVSKLTLQLDSSAVLLGGRPRSSTRQGDVCAEVYLGNQVDYPYFYKNWVEEKCDYGQSVDKLVTLVFRGESIDQVERVTRSLWDEYAGVRVIVESDLDIHLKGVHSVRKGRTMADIASKVDTKYVLIGKDLDHVSNWTSLARGVRLLSEGGLAVVAVGGAVRNTSGHWHVDCRQVEMEYYRLEMRPGYEHQFNDCMVCDFVDGPVLMKTDTMRSLDPEIPKTLSLVDLALTRVGLMLACPDIMFFTRSSIGRETLHSNEADWLKLAAKYKFQGLVTNFKHQLDFQFSCSQVNLICDIRSQAAAFILPWCCFESFRYILSKLEEASSKLGIEYQLESGSCLGAVKLANFIPWDIDMDIEFLTEHFHHFKSGGAAHVLLKGAGISLYGYSEDMYAIKGAGMFNMHYNGITVEMMGSIKPLSMNLLPNHLKNKPTRIQLAKDLWVPVLSNPGLYVRGRYGPGYLFHIQSWRHKDGMSGSYDSYQPGAWAPCTQPGHQACLNRYPIQGNIELLSEIYP